ncbi:Cyclin N-terminal domain-containing protein 1 [Dufourea novaeangliae]|uniref:Cyclin N-terminal domain-containing protein 1 n=1 Tax=Dufourea novaeangliae TaxID=178035 RepID=A0A154PBD0_DUFNO|nr:Cyclin N-terminal domain-containing protein 1 [Dufourea novaeangliae]
MPFVAIPVPIVSAIFKITEHLYLGPDTRYIAIHLYDKFMCKYFWEVYKTEAADHTENSWSQVCRKISSQSKLYLMSCLQLANKMDSHPKNLGISQVLDILQCIDKKSEYNHSVVFLSEFKVFKMVGFRMPFCTPLNCIQVLLAATGLKDTPNMQDLTITLLDLVYLQVQIHYYLLEPYRYGIINETEIYSQREKLYSHLQCLAQRHIAKTDQEKRNLMTLKTNVLFLGASIVLCGIFFSCIDAETGRIISSKLSDLVDIESDNIWDMANILLVLAIQE